MFKALKEYMHKKDNFTPKQFISYICGIFYVSGIFGFIYETLFYIINNEAYTRRGSQFGPWIQIYGLGGLVIFLMCIKIKDKPLLVFILSGAVCGALEYLAGYLMEMTGSPRTWDYNVEIWNWGNINGFICIRSVLFFAVSGLFLIYIVFPILLWIESRLSARAFFLIMVIPALIFAADIAYNDGISKAIGSPDAMQLYEKSGWYDQVATFTPPSK